MLWQAILLLLLTAMAIALLHRFRLPALLGYIAAGIVLRELGYDLYSQNDSLRFLGELGLVFMLFALGLEFSFSQLKSLRRFVFVLGPLQLLITSALTFAAVYWMQLPLAGAIVIALAVAQSSTALSTKILSEQRELNSKHGRVVVGLSLFQDISAIPLLILVPSLGNIAALSWTDALLLPLLKGITASILLIWIGRRALPVVFQSVTRTMNEELFVLMCLLVILLAAGVTHALGLSMALGAFLAGTLLGESQYRIQVQAEIRPFRDVLLGLFFVSVGNLMQLDHFWQHALWVMALLPLVFVIKASVIIGICRRLRVRRVEAIQAGLILAQIGEFGLALIALAADNRLLTRDYVSIALATAIVSMMLTPLLIRHAAELADMLLRKHYKHDEEGDTLHQIEAATEGMQDHIIIAGYGRVGQLVHRFTANENYAVIALDRDAQRVQEATNAGLNVRYGDAAHNEVLIAAGIDRARMLVVCVDKLERSVLITQHARAINATVPILVRTQDDTHADYLRENGATEIVPEVLEGSLMLVSHVMVMLGVPVTSVLQRVQRARRDRYRQLKGFFFGSGADVSQTSTKAKQQLHAVTLSENCVGVGKSIASLNLADLQIEIRQITRHHHELPSPNGDEVLQVGDMLVLMGPPDGIEAAERRLLSGRPKFSRL